MTKADLIQAVCERLGVPRKEGARMVNMLFDIMREELVNGNKIKISGFGNFEVRHKKSRPGRNPLNGQPIIISERKVLVFKPSQVLRRALNPHRYEDKK